MEKVDDHQEKRKVNEKKINKIFWILLSLILLFLLIGISRSCGKKQAVKTEDKLAIKAPQNPYLSKIDSLQRSLVDLQKQLDQCNGSKVKKVPAPVKKVMKKRKQIPPVVKAEPVFIPVPNVEINLPERGSLKSEAKTLQKEKSSPKKISVPKKIEVQKIEPEDDECPGCQTTYGAIKVRYQ